MNSGLLAAALAGAAACLVVAPYGSYLSWRVGFGLDSGLAARYGFFAVTMLVLAVPLQSVEGAIAAAVASDVRKRVADRGARRRTAYPSDPVGSGMDFDVDAWREELSSYRDRKDEQFANARASPLPPAEREEFDGLDYFEPDPDYRVEATLELDDSDETVTMETTADGEQLYERAARLRFDVPDASGDPTERTLVAYQRVDHEGGSLFVPFRDKTTGQQTYPGGRYMELHYEGASGRNANSASEEGSDSRRGGLEDGATIPLDFNLAYNPFCAYGDAYECPLPPRENWLEIAIPAGERYPHSPD